MTMTPAGTWFEMSHRELEIEASNTERLIHVFKTTNFACREMAETAIAEGCVKLGELNAALNNFSNWSTYESSDLVNEAFRAAKFYHEANRDGHELEAEYQLGALGEILATCASRGQRWNWQLLGSGCFLDLSPYEDPSPKNIVCD